MLGTISVETHKLSSNATGKYAHEFTCIHTNTTTKNRKIINEKTQAHFVKWKSIVCSVCITYYIISYRNTRVVLFVFVCV